MLKQYFHAVQAERLKLKHSRIFLPCILLPLLGVVIGTGNFYANQNTLTAEWSSLWTQVSLFYGYFFYPILLAICSSYLWRMEHTNHNWNPLMTSPVPRSIIFTAKLSVLSALALLVQLFLIVLYWLSGTLVFHFSTGFPLAGAVQWTLCGWLASLCVSALQLYLSMRIRSFAIPIGISLGCSIIGLGFFGAGLGRLFPTSLVGLGLSIAKGAVLTAGNVISILFMSFLYTLLFCLLAVHYLRKKDISAS